MSVGTITEMLLSMAALDMLTHPVITIGKNITTTITEMWQSLGINPRKNIRPSVVSVVFIKKTLDDVLKLFNE